MIESAIINYCMCCMAPADLCKNNPPAELQYEVIVKLKEVKEDAATRIDRLGA